MTLFLSSFGTGSFGFDRRLLRVVGVYNVVLMLYLLKVLLSCSLAPWMQRRLIFLFGLNSSSVTSVVLFDCLHDEISGVSILL